MDSIKIETGAKRLSVERDGIVAGEIVFNPNDVSWVENFFALADEMAKKVSAFEKRYAELSAQAEADELGIPINVNERVIFVREFCAYMRERIDKIFGAGTSQILFGDALLVDSIMQFFENITPYVKTARAEKVAPYLGKKSKVLK